MVVEEKSSLVWVFCPRKDTNSQRRGIHYRHLDNKQSIFIKPSLL
jgi:hypothetical protein